MHEPSASEILDVWERGRGRTLPERALELLELAGAPSPPEQLRVGERDRLLLELRTCMFGPRVPAAVSCPSCGELLELELGGDDLLSEPPPAAELTLDLGGRTIAFRLPTGADLVAVARSADVEEGRRLLLRRCVDAELSPEEEDAVIARMGEADPGAWIELVVRCSACEHAWSADFDVVSFLWTELESSAQRLIADVHTLASAYGWREHDVLTLSASRREAYLELAAE